MRPSVLVAIVLCTIVPRATSAQQFFTPGAEVNGQISVQVNATLNDGIDQYQPVSGLTLTLYRGATDSMQLRTDDAGVLRFAIAAGMYRLSTPEPVRWHGRSYRWNIPLAVRPRMEIVNLTVANATIVGPAVAERPRVVVTDEAIRSNPSSIPYAQKDGATGVLFGFLLTGGGQFYAGKNTKGAVLLGLSLAEAVAAVSVINRCNPYCTDSDISTADVLLLPIVFNWVYGMATAPGDVRGWNEAHARVARVRPVIENRRRHRIGPGREILKDAWARWATKVMRIPEGAPEHSCVGEKPALVGVRSLRPG